MSNQIAPNIKTKIACNSRRILNCKEHRVAGALKEGRGGGEGNPPEGYPQIPRQKCSINMMTKEKHIPKFG